MLWSDANLVPNSVLNTLQHRSLGLFTMKMFMLHAKRKTFQKATQSVFNRNPSISYSCLEQISEIKIYEQSALYVYLLWRKSNQNVCLQFFRTFQAFPLGKRFQILFLVFPFISGIMWKYGIHWELFRQDRWGNTPLFLLPLLDGPQALTLMLTVCFLWNRSLSIKLPEKASNRHAAKTTVIQVRLKK